MNNISGRLSLLLLAADGDADADDADDRAAGGR